MKKITLLLITVLELSHAMASGKYERLDLTYLMNTETGQTPYQKMETLFNQGVPMQLNQFLTLQDPSLKDWSCVGSKKDTTTDQLSVVRNVPIYTQGKIVTSPAIPAVPAKGPLFPETPEIPEQYVLVDAVIIYYLDYSYDLDQKEIGEFVQRHKLKVVTSPGVTVSFLNNPQNEKSHVKTSYRTTNGLIIFKQEARDPGISATLFDYYYCWKK